MLALVAREAVAKTVGGAGGRHGARQMALQLVGGWLHADRFVRAVRRSGGVPRELLPWLEGRKHHGTSGLFEVPQDSSRDLADPAFVTPARFAVAALKYVVEGTPLLAEGEALVDAVKGWFTHEVEGGQAPHIDLLREIETARDRLSTWLQPKREPDGRIQVGSTELVPPAWAPSALAQALSQFEEDAFSQAPWITLGLVRQGGVLRDDELARFHAATDDLDLPALFSALGEATLAVIGTLARNAQRPEDAQRRATLRQAFLAVEEAGDEHSPTSSEEPRQENMDDKGQLTVLQGAILEGSYSLAQAEESPAQAMAAFALDLRNLGKSDAVYLRRVRTVVEELVLERPLAEAEQLASLLFEARGS